MSWRCAWCWSMNLSDQDVYCPRCGRDIEAVERRHAGRPRIQEPEWDGVVLHNVPGLRGYRDHRCRCPECMDAVAAWRESERERKRRKKESS